MVVVHILHQKGACGKVLVPMLLVCDLGLGLGSGTRCLALGLPTTSFLGNRTSTTTSDLSLFGAVKASVEAADLLFWGEGRTRPPRMPWEKSGFLLHTKQLTSVVTRIQSLLLCCKKAPEKPEKPIYAEKCSTDNKVTKKVVANFPEVRSLHRREG